jgi:hypothetical protein
VAPLLGRAALRDAVDDQLALSALSLLTASLAAPHCVTAVRAEVTDAGAVIVASSREDGGSCATQRNAGQSGAGDSGVSRPSRVAPPTSVIVRGRMVFGDFVPPEVIAPLRFGELEGGMEEPGMADWDARDDDDGAMLEPLAATSASSLINDSRGLRQVEAMARTRMQKLATERHHDRVNRSRKKQ